VADVTPLQRAAWRDWAIEIMSAHAATPMAATPAEIATIADQHVNPLGSCPA
jgi:hypothetical protein